MMESGDVGNNEHHVDPISHKKSRGAKHIQAETKWPTWVANGTGANAWRDWMFCTPRALAFMKRMIIEASFISWYHKR